MASGTKYLVKENLLNAIANRVFFNEDFATSSTDIQLNDCDIVESLWDRAADANVNNVTYGDLVTNITNQTLIPGTWYAFDYQTIHHIEGGVYNDTTTIYDRGDNSEAAFTPETETLLVLAVSTSEISSFAISRQHPRDLIFYDITNDRTEDDGRDRDGFIIYRKDVDNELSAYFDWRNVLHRRHISDQTFDTVTWDAYVKNYSDVIDIASSLNTAVPYMAPDVATFAGPIPMLANVDTRDYKTFVGFEEASLLVDGGYFKNIEIGFNHSATFVSGSGSGSSIPAPTLNGTIADVVIFGQQAYDIKIGGNVRGITLIGRQMRNIEIGNTNENISISGIGSIQYPGVGTPPSFQGYSENIKIGNSNRNITFDRFNRNYTIGNSNTGIAISGDSSNVSLNNENNGFWGLWLNNIEVDNANQDLVISNHQDLKVGSFNDNIRIFASSFFTQGEATPDVGFGIDGSSAYGRNVGPQSFIYNNVNNADISLSGNFNVHSRCTDICITRSDDVTIGVGCTDVNIAGSPGSSVGRFCSNIDIKSISIGTNTIGNQSSNIAISGSYNKVGTGCSNIALLSDVNDTQVGDACNNIYATWGFSNTIGNRCFDIHLRASSRNNIGQGCSDIFAESANNNKVGSGSTQLSFNNLGLNFKFSISNLFTNFLMATTFDSLNEARYFGRTRLDVVSTPLGQSLQTREAAFFPNSEPTPSSNNTVGEGCAQIFFCSSSNNIIGNGVAGCAFGTNGYQGTSNYSITFDSGTGAATAYDSAFVQANGLHNGKLCNGNTLDSACAGIVLEGTSYNNNNFAAGVTGITTTAAAGFVDNKVLVDGLALTVTVLTANKVIDKVSPDTERWYNDIDNAGTLAGYAKLV